MQARNFNFLAVACLVAASLSPSVGSAQTVRTWDGGSGGTGTAFLTAANWSGDTVPANGAVAQFNGTVAGNLSLTFSAAVGSTSGILLDLTAGQTGSLTVNNTSASAQTFRLATGTSSIAAGAGAFTLGASGTANPISLGLGTGSTLSAYTLQNNSSNTATIGQNVSVVRGGGGGQRDLILSGTGAWAIQGSLGGSNTDVSLFVDGATVTLSGSNSHALGTTVSSGALNVSGVGTLGATTNALTVSGGLVDLGTTSQTVGAATLTGGTISNGTLTASSISAQAGTVSAVLAGAGGFTKSTAGTVTLTGSNTLSGAISVQEGSLVLTGGTNRLPVAAAVALGTGSTTGKLVLGSAAGRSNQTLASVTASGLGGSVVGGNANASVLTLSPASGTVTFGGALGGAGANENSLSLTKDGAGVLVLTGSSSFTGGTDFSRGTIELGNDAALGAGTVTIVGNANAKRLRSSDATSRTIANVVSLGGDLRLGGVGTGTLIFTGSWNGGSIAKLLTVDSAVELRGNINKTSTALTKDGIGTLLLSGTASAFANTLAVTAGAVDLTGILGSGSAAVSIASGARIGGTGSIAGDLALASGGLYVFNPLDPTLDVTGAVTLDNTFGVASLVNADGSAINWGSVNEGTYTLIGTTASTFNNIQNFGVGAAADIGGGRTAYFQNGSLQLVIVPEPGAFVLAGFGVAALWALGRRSAARRRATG
jgi:autotransporter-associated beta strand protein